MSEERAGDVQREQPLVEAHRGASVRFVPDGRSRPPRPAADRHDRGGQLDARPRGGARARRLERRRRAPRRRVLRLPRTTSAPASSCSARRTGRGRGDDPPPADAARRGDHRLGGRGARAGDDRRARRTSTRASRTSRTCPRTSTSRSSPCRSSRAACGSRARSTSARASRARSPTTRSSCCSRSRRRCAQSIEHAKLYAEAQRRVHELEALARISEAVSESLYLEESLEAIVKTTMDALSATGAALVLEDGEDRVAGGPRGRARDPPAAALARPADRRARRRPRDAVHPARPRAARVDRPAGRGRARARPRGDARRARPGDPPPGQEQPADGRVAAAAPGPRRGPGRLAQGARGLGQPHPRDRRRPRGADRAARRRRRPRRPVRAAARDARPGRRRRPRGRRRARAGLARRPPRDRARARLLGAARRTRSSTAARTSTSSSRSRNGDVVLAISDDGPGIAGEPSVGTGLSIVRALVRDELRGTIDLTSGGRHSRRGAVPRLDRGGRPDQGRRGVDASTCACVPRRRDRRWREMRWLVCGLAVAVVRRLGRRCLRAPRPQSDSGRESSGRDSRVAGH